MKVLSITTPDIENGIGCRVTIWISGCNRRCPGCHNQRAWDYNLGSNLMSEKVLSKICECVDHDYIDGITLSGGDPLDQTDDNLRELLEFIKGFKDKFPQKDIWIYSGGLYEDLINEPLTKDILSECDVLVDGPFVQSMKVIDLPFRGSINQRIIDIKQSLVKGTIIVLK